MTDQESRQVVRQIIHAEMKATLSSALSVRPIAKEIVMLVAIWGQYLLATTLILTSESASAFPASTGTVLFWSTSCLSVLPFSTASAKSMLPGVVSLLAVPVLVFAFDASSAAAVMLGCALGAAFVHGVAQALAKAPLPLVAGVGRSRDRGQ